MCGIKQASSAEQTELWKQLMKSKFTTYGSALQITLFELRDDELRSRRFRGRDVRVRELRDRVIFVNL